MYFLTLHSSYGRQLIAVQNGCFQWLASLSFLSVPRSLFAPDGKMVHYFESALMTILEKSIAWWCIRAKSDHWSSGKYEWKIKYGTLISAASCSCWRQKLAERQSHCKAVGINDCSQWAEPYTARIIHKCESNDEVCPSQCVWKQPPWVNGQACQDRL